MCVEYETPSPTSDEPTTYSPTIFEVDTECVDMDESACIEATYCEAIYYKKGKGKKAKEVFDMCVEYETPSPTSDEPTTYSPTIFTECMYMYEKECIEATHCEAIYYKKGKGKKAKEVFDMCVEYETPSPTSDEPTTYFPTIFTECMYMYEKECIEATYCEAIYYKKGKGKKAKEVFDECVEYETPPPTLMCNHHNKGQCKSTGGVVCIWRDGECVEATNDCAALSVHQCRKSPYCDNSMCSVNGEILDDELELEACDVCTKGKHSPCSFKKGKLVPTRACKNCIESQCNEPEEEEPMGCCFKVSFGAMMKPIHHEYTPLLASECDEEENMGGATRWEEISCEELIEQHADDYEDDEDEDEDEDDEPEACDACTEGKKAPCSFRKGKLVPTKACKKCIESQCNEPEEEEPMGCCFKVSFGAMMKPIHHEYTPLLASECDEEENMGGATRWEEISCEELIEQHADDYEDDEDEDEDDEPGACDACTEGKMAPCSFKKGKLVPTKACKKCIESQCNEPEDEEEPMGCCFKVSFGAMMKPSHYEYTPVLASECDEEERMGAATRWEEISCEELIEQHADDYEDDEDEDEDEDDEPEACDACTEGKKAPCSFRKGKLVPTKRAKSASNHNAMNPKRKSLWVAASRLVSVL